MSISINKISKAYNNELALNNISFNIKKGEIVGFLGPNGAGKSTLMKIICGSLKQDKGEVSVCKINSKKNMLLVKSKIGYNKARKLAFAPHINIGVFSLEKNSVGWITWQKNLE